MRGSGRLWVVFGAGGDRDPGKRAPMGAAAAAGADVVVVTSDNPRTEDPAHIVAQVAAGAQSGAPAARPKSIVRGRSRMPVDAADPADVVLIAGKGHEDYQIIGTEKRPFSDLEQARRGWQSAQAHGAGAPKALALRRRGSARMSALMTVTELARAVAAQEVRGDGRTALFERFDRYAHAGTRARSSSRLRGERFDAHDYRRAARRTRCRRAAGRARARCRPCRRSSLPTPSARSGRGAAQWRARFTLPVIAVAGSNGKTTVTQMIAAILAQALASGIGWPRAAT